jgi:hypothetical protein
MNMPIGKIRVVALGGCGGMGQFAVRTALGFDFIDEIVMADRDEQRVRGFAECCGPKTTPVGLDVQDETALANVLEGADVVMTTVGPYEDAAPFEEISVDYPGVGPVTTHTVGHPEPITLPLFRPEIRNSWNVMNMPPYVIKPLRWVAGQVDAGRMSIDEATDQVNDILAAGTGWVKLLLSGLGRKMFLEHLLSFRKTIPYIATLFAHATGSKDGRPRRVGARLAAVPYGGMQNETMGGVTGVPLATALAMFAKGKIERRGVLAPESAIDPDAFFDELAPLCTPKKKDAKELVEISTS